MNENRRVQVLLGGGDALDVLLVALACAVCALLVDALRIERR